MNKRMKIAIPTDDGLIVRTRFSSSRGFMVATVKSGKIIHQEMRWNLLSEMMTSEDGYFYNLADCDIVIVKEVGHVHAQILEIKNITIARTGETEIMAAFLQYLKCIHLLSEVNQIA
jgi:predicted Fe-Mo cluster-binding NifX family protein